MTETLPGSTAPSPDTTNVLPNLSENKGSLSLTLTIDKSVKRIAEWILPTIIALILVIAGCALVMGLNLAKQDQMDRDFKDMKTQDWLKERRLMDREAYDILNGRKVVGDDTNGPTGNLQRMKPERK